MEKIGDRKQETGDRRQETGDRRQETNQYRQLSEIRVNLYCRREYDLEAMEVFLCGSLLAHCFDLPVS